MTRYVFDVINKVANVQNSKLTKWHVDKMADDKLENQQNDRSMKWKFDKVQLDTLKIGQMSCSQNCRLT